MVDMQIFISQVYHDSDISTSISATTRTNTSAGDRSRSSASAAFSSMRGGQTTASAGPAMGTASVASAAKSATKEKNPKPLADPLNVKVVNPDLKEDLWSTYKYHCSPIQNAADECKMENTLLPSPYDVSVDSCPS